MQYFVLTKKEQNFCFDENPQFLINYFVKLRFVLTKYMNLPNAPHTR